MPDLPILGSDGKLSLVAPLVVFAITTYPKDEKKQQELIASRFLGTLPEGSDSAVMIRRAVKTFPWIVQALHRAGTPDQVIEEAARYHASSWAAGEILLTMLSAAIHHPEVGIGPTKAVDSLAHFFQGKPTYGGTEAEAGERTLWTAWRRFKSVAHFHAARQLWTYDHHPGPETFAAWTEDNFEEYLAVAEEIRREAALRRLIKEVDAWRVPQALQLRPMQLNLVGLDADLLKILTRYRPKHSNKM